MENIIHPSAIVETGAKLGKNNYIGPYCYIGPKVKIGNNNRFEAYCSVGTAPEHRDCFFSDDHFGVEIGNNNVIREFVTINGGWLSPTTLKNNIVMLRHSHAGHDVLIHDFVNIACDVLLGGHCIVHYRANIGLGAVIHQKLAVGALAMVGMNSTVTRDVVPFSKTFGSPAISNGANIIGLERAGIQSVHEIMNWLTKYDMQIRIENQEKETTLPSEVLPYFKEWLESISKLRKPMSKSSCESNVA